MYIGISQFLLYNCWTQKRTPQTSNSAGYNQRQGCFSRNSNEWWIQPEIYDCSCWTRRSFCCRWWSHHSIWWKKVSKCSIGWWKKIPGYCIRTTRRKYRRTTWGIDCCLRQQWSISKKAFDHLFQIDTELYLFSFIGMLVVCFWMDKRSIDTEIGRSILDRALRLLLSIPTRNDW